LPFVGKNLVLLGAAYFALNLAGGLPSVAPGWTLWLPIWLAALCLLDAIMAHHQILQNRESFFQVRYSAILAFGVGLAVTWHQASPQNFPLILVLEGVLLTLSIYLLRVPIIALFAQGYLIIAQAVWLANFAFADKPLPPWWNSAALIALTLGLSHWWQKQRVLITSAQMRLAWQGLYSLALVGILYYCLCSQVNPSIWLSLIPLLALVVTGYAVMTRAWLLAACAQLFVLASGIQFVKQLWVGEPVWYFPLAPIAALGVFAFGAVKWFQSHPQANPRISRPLLQLAQAYRWAGLVMSLWWVWKYIPEPQQVWVFILLGLVVFAWAGWRRNREALLFGTVFTVAGLALFWFPGHDISIVTWPNLLAILFLLGQQAVAKRLPSRYQVDSRIQGAVIIVGGLSLWLLLSKWVVQLSQYSASEGGYLTASWCVLALGLFSWGILLRERIYRWLGLAILACGLGRVMIIDVWRLAPIFRILSFMVLGMVLLVLGFIYNKYQEKIKEWL
jgi:hypothetical protein